MNEQGNTSGKSPTGADVAGGGTGVSPSPVNSGQPPRDGKTYVLQYAVPVRWKPYKPGSQQAKMGIAGRWQKMSEYGGWDNFPGVKLGLYGGISWSEVPS